MGLSIQVVTAWLADSCGSLLLPSTMREIELIAQEQIKFKTQNVISTETASLFTIINSKNPK